MSTKNPLKLDLSKFTEQVKNLPITKINKFDDILSDLANHAYDAFEYILELPEKIEELSKEKAVSMINDLTALQCQVTPLMDILCDMDYGSKYMYRVKEELGTIEDEIPELLKRLEKKIKDEN
ncbi:MAG: hypothetical protein NTV01_20660 [Bacteroidia bacterium]|nr:hypothetical protein [Bacteroidia bacterium]